MALVDRIIWQIENHSDEPLSLEQIADRCAVSRAHMCRAFQLSTGLSVMAYLRARRLSVAAQALAHGSQAIVQVALDAGYGSHEAFTRAFFTYTGQRPSDVRAAGSVDNLKLMEPLEMDKSMIVDVPAPEMKAHRALRVVGLGMDVHGFEIREIPALWQRFAQRYVEIGPPGVTYGVSYDMGGDGDFHYMAGMEGPNVPEGMDVLEVPAARYAVFTHCGSVGDLPKTVYSIWNKALPDRGIEPAMTPNFERCDKRFDARTGRGEIEVWIPVV